jgi:hypothetical protein
MAQHTRVGVAAVASAVLTAGAGLVTNLITEEGSLTLAIVLGLLIAGSAFTAWVNAVGARGATPRTRIKQHATDGGEIIGSRIQAGDGAEVEQKANGGRIESSDIEARSIHRAGEARGRDT